MLKEKMHLWVSFKHALLNDQFREAAGSASAQPQTKREDSQSGVQTGWRNESTSSCAPVAPSSA